jgi:hypothetical protein
MSWIHADKPVPMEAVAGDVEIRGVIRQPYPGRPPIQGYDFRFQFRRPPTVPGEDTPDEWTPWMFVSAQGYMKLIEQMTHHAHTKGHLSPGDTNTSGQLQ